MTPSIFQAAIYTFGADPQAGNAIVEAVAGSGKTTTIVELCNKIQGSKIFLAFNKAIATELQARGVNAKTFHSLTFSIVKRATGFRDVELNKPAKLMRANFSDREVSLYSSFACKLVGLAMQTGIGCLVQDTDDAWGDIVEHHSIELDNDQASYTRGIEVARELLAHCIQAAAQGMVSFDDMLYLPVLHGWKLPTFDSVIVDEAQDTNAIQRALLRKIMTHASRLFAVGDPNQAIYGFRGADSDSLALIAREFNARKFPLSISYRCAQAIVREAQRFVPSIQASETAPEGTVQTVEDWTTASFLRDDLVVCRNTKPLIALAYQCLRDGIAVRVLGREIGEGLTALIKRMNAKGIDALIAKLDEYKNRETQKLIAKGAESAAEMVEDKVESIIFLAGALKETERTVPALIATIERLFDQTAGRTTLATIHKSKGLEANRVWWLAPSLCPSKWARQDWQKQQERNLIYVAITRAKTTLFKIEPRD